VGTGLLLIALFATAGAYVRDAASVHERLADDGHPLFSRFPATRRGLPLLTAIFGLALGLIALGTGALAVLGVLDL
jgi:hypothetical protein